MGSMLRAVNCADSDGRIGFHPMGWVDNPPSKTLN
jgi:hypothetical protein